MFAIELDAFDQRCFIGAGWGILFSVVYWVNCALIVYYQRSAAQRTGGDNEWDAVDWRRKRQIVSVVLQNQIVATCWLVICSLLLPAWRNWWPIANLWWPLSILLFAIVNDFVFFTAHRALHSKMLYWRFHSVHHEIKTACAPAAIYCHWVEMCCANLMQVTVPVFVLGFDDWMITLLIVVAAIEATLSHSRYSKYHFLHHRILNVRYGASLAVCDRIAQTHSSKSNSSLEKAKVSWTKN